MIIDFHTHIFPDSIATKALNNIKSTGGIKPVFDGTLKGLLYSMDKAGISKSVVLSIATKPEQFDSILKWSKTIQSDRIIPFLSVHPDDKNAIERIFQIKKEGFKGIKLHPYYQQFYIDEERIFPLYEVIEKTGLIVVMHSGYDFAYEKIDKAGPQRILKIIKKFPQLKLVAAHLGGWEQWKQVKDYLVGKNLFFETSFTDGFLSDSEFEEIILKHHSDMILFGTDTPWADQKKSVEKIKTLDISEGYKEKIFYKNASKILGID